VKKTGTSGGKEWCFYIYILVNSDQRSSGGRVPLVPIKSFRAPAEVQYATCLSRQQDQFGSLHQSTHEHGQREIAQRVPAGGLTIPHQSRGNREYNFNVYVYMCLSALAVYYLNYFT